MRLWVALLIVVVLLAVALPRLVSATSPETSTTASPYDFEKMAALVKRLDAVENSAPESIVGFYEPKNKSFSVKPGTMEKRVCVTSTCYSLLTILLSSEVYDSVISYEEVSEDENEAGTTVPTVAIPIQQVMMTILKSQWREDDLFQVPLLLYSLLRFDTDGSLLRRVASDDRIASRIRTMISFILKAACPDPRLRSQKNSDYVIYQVCKVFSLLLHATTEQKPRFPDNLLPQSASSSQFYHAVCACAEVSSNELCRQLAYHSAGDSNSFDVIRLAYSLLTVLRSTRVLQECKKSARDLDRDLDSPKVPPLNKKLVAAALKVYFDEQNKNGLWPKGQPIYKSFRRQGRSMANAFVFSLNTLGSLLCELPAEDFRPFLGAIENSLTWIENHQTVEMIDYCDPETGEHISKAIRGWSSPHTSDDLVPQAWPTAQVLKCSSWMRKTLKTLMHNDVLNEFNGLAFSDTPAHLPFDGWDRLLDSDLGDPTKGACRTLKSVLEERVIHPFETSIDTPSYGVAYSAILFGPPGTAKTSICEALAQRLRWDFCVIDTSSFLADGLSNVAARIRYIFSRLMALEKCVILFDEIEEFGLDRETPGLSMESRMLTTAMLTAINDLRRNERSIFFIATNRLKAFDSAITRRGRFDMHLFVGAPNLSSKVLQFQQKLTSARLSEEQRKKALEAYRSFLANEWSKDAMFMTFLEGLQFASACAHAAEVDKELKPEVMSRILKHQAAVMTVRSSARDDYIRSMEMSRL